MPADFTASALPIIPIEMVTVFQNLGTVNPELNNVPVTVAAVLERQTTRINPIKSQAGDLCVGAEVWYYVNDTTTIPTVSATPIASVCEITGGLTISTDNQAYDLNVFLKPKISLNDLDCDNASKFASRAAFSLASALQKMAISLNNKMIAVLEANKSTPVAGNLPDGVTIAGEYTITGTTYWQGIDAAKIIPVLDQLATIKGLTGNYYIISGKSLQIPKILASDARANDNERSYITTISRRDIINDPKNVDAIIGADVIYLVDPSAVFGYFANLYTASMEAPQPVGDSLNTKVFSIPLYYYDNYQSGNFNRSTMRYMNGESGLTDVMVDVRVQKVCNVTGQFGSVSYDYNWELSLMGLIDVVPRASATNTGIIRINKA